MITLLRDKSSRSSLPLSFRLTLLCLLGLYLGSNADKKYYWLFREKPQGIQLDLSCVEESIPHPPMFLKLSLLGQETYLFRFQKKKQNKTKKQSSKTGGQSVDRIQFLLVSMSPGVEPMSIDAYKICSISFPENSNKCISNALLLQSHWIQLQFIQKNNSSPKGTGFFFLRISLCYSWSQNMLC